MPRVLIIAFGNPLRSDDGVAWRAADILAEKFSAPNVEILRLHQLAPELAETLTAFDCVIFVDAAVKENSDIEVGSVRVTEVLTETSESGRFSHAFSPQKVVGLAAALYGARPRAFVVTVCSANFDHGSVLSPSVENALPNLVSTIERLVRDAESKA